MVLGCACAGCTSPAPPGAAAPVPGANTGGSGGGLFLGRDGGGVAVGGAAGSPAADAGSIVGEDASDGGAGGTAGPGDIGGTGGSAGAGSGGGSGVLDCSALWSCVGGCADQRCDDDCLNRAQPGARELLLALASCLQANSCADEACAMAKCQDQILACADSVGPGGAGDGGSGGVGGGGASGSGGSAGGISGSTGSGGGGGATVTPSSTFPDGSTGTNGRFPQLLIDAAGTRHYAYQTTTTDMATGKYVVRYGECSGDCTLASHWNFLALGDRGAFGSQARMALTAEGRPRLIWGSQNTPAGAFTLTFGRCDSGCTEPAGWTTGVFKVLANDTISDNPGRTMAIDASGRVHFVYGSGGASVSTRQMHYATCGQDCTTAAGWTDVALGLPGTFDGPASLAVTAGGQVHVTYTGGPSGVLVYRSCDGQCEVTGNWAPETTLYYSHQGLVSLRLDSQGHPRLMFNQALSRQPAGDRQSFYAWCDGGCGSGTQWKSRSVGSVGDGTLGLDFDLDGSGNPIGAMTMNDVVEGAGPLGLLRCTASCQTSGATWTVHAIEKQVEAGFNWYVGEQASVAIPPRSTSLEVAHRSYRLEYGPRGQVFEAVSIPRFTRGD
jgi:hypothetical protein